MGKVQNRSKFKPSSRRQKRPVAKKPQEDVLVLHRNLNPSTEQIARSEALGRFLEEKRRKMAAMTPEENRQADEDWEKFKKSINEGRKRKVILD